MTKKANKSNSKKSSASKGSDGQRNIAADYGWAMSFMNKYPQLKKIFNDAVNNGWSTNRFVAEVQDTNWFKNHSDSWRTNKYLAITDPSTYQQRVGQTAEVVNSAAGQLGIHLSKNQLNEMSEQAFLSGWDAQGINDHLASMVDIMNTHNVGGDLATTENSLRQFANDNGVALSDNTLQGWLQQIVRGSSTQQEYQNYISKQAQAKFPNWSKELGTGMTVAQIADPYKQAMGNLLEINPDTINVTNPLISKGLSTKDPKTGEYAAMNLSDFEDSVRQDSRWQYTQNAKDTIGSVATNLAKSFGVIG